MQHKKQTAHTVIIYTVPVTVQGIVNKDHRFFVPRVIVISTQLKKDRTPKDGHSLTTHWNAHSLHTASRPYKPLGHIQNFNRFRRGHTVVVLQKNPTFRLARAGFALIFISAFLLGEVGGRNSRLIRPTPVLELYPCNIY